MAHSQTPFRTAAAVCRISGPAATGKTEELVRRVAQLLKDGAAADAIAVFAATPDACKALAARIAAAAPGCKVPRVRTALEYQLELLALPEAVRATGCDCHVMLRFEENIFMEDMKTCGVQPKRLAQMLRFLYRSCCDLEHMTSQWFFNDEEEKAYNLLIQLQRYYGAYLRQMVPYFAYTFASDFPGTVAKTGLTYPHVFVDDYPTLSKASQCLLGLVATKTLTVAADPQALVTCLEDFPYPGGFEDLAQQNEGCTDVTLQTAFAAGAITEALNTLRADEALAGPAAQVADDAPQGALQLQAFGSPTAELTGIAGLVAQLVTQGTRPDAIAVAAPKPTWEKNLVTALRDAGVAVAPKRRPNISGDVRTMETCFDGRVVTLLKLMANPDDRLATRCWCGFGDYLANSALFTGMCRYDVHVKLDTANISTTGNADALFTQQRDRILDALDLARMLLPQLEGLTGMALAKKAAAIIDPSRPLNAQMLRAFEDAGENADAAALVAALEQQVNLPCFAGEGVRVGLLCDFLGLNPQVMVLSGMVNGLIPERNYFDPTMIERDRRPALLAVDSAKTYAAAGKATEQLVLGYFTSAPLVESETMRLKAVRVRVIDGKRQCQIDPSETLRALTGVYFND